MTNSIRILYLDNDPEGRELVRKALEQDRGGFKVMEAASRAELYAALNTLDFDLILSDINIEGLNGLQVLQAVHSKEPSLPVVIITAIGSEEIAAESMKYGAADYIVKRETQLERLPIIIREALQRTQVENALHLNTIAMEAAAMSILITDRNGRIEWLNPAYSTLTGYTLAESMGRKPGDLVKSGIHDADFYKNMWETILAGQVWRGQVINRHKDGSLYHEEMTITPIKDRSGTITHFMGIKQNITERKRAEEALRESQRRLYTLMSNLPGLAYRRKNDSQWTMEFVSEGCLALTGYQSEDLVDNNKISFDALIHSDERQAVREEMQAALKEQRSYQLSYRIITASGEEKWVWEQGRGVYTDKGETVALEGFVADISERIHAEETLRKRLRELETLYSISFAVRSVTTVEEALPKIMDETLSALDTDAGAVMLYNAQGNELQCAVTRGWFKSFEKMPLKSSEEITRSALTKGTTYLIDDFAKEFMPFRTTGFLVPHGWSGACLPIHAGSEIVGVLIVAVQQPRQIAEEQMKLLTSLVEIAGITMHRVKLYDDALLRLNHVQILQKIDRMITTSLDLRLSLRFLLNELTSMPNVDAADVLMFHPVNMTLEYVDGRGFRNNTIQERRIRPTEGIVGRATMERKLLNFNSPEEAVGDIRHQIISDEGFFAYYVIPLVVKGKSLGALETYHRRPPTMNAEWIEFLTAVADQAAIAIDTTQLLENLRQTNINLTLSYDATIKGWSNALDLRDKETEGHTQRVTDLTQKLATVMGVDSKRLSHIKHGALLHDIGKIGVPDHILLKADQLTDDEWETMRRHPSLAYELLLPIEFLRPALDIPYCHHEKWDGTGYPRGLRGEEIPLAARIFAIVDVYDALTSNRPYREAWTKEQALEHINKLSGSHFDPKVVGAFNKLISNL